MKIVLLSLSTATLLGLAFLVGGLPFDFGMFISSCFVAVLLAWTIAQYRRKPYPLARARPIHLPVRLIRHESKTSQKFTRLAA